MKMGVIYSDHGDSAKLAKRQYKVMLQAYCSSDKRPDINDKTEANQPATPTFAKRLKVCAKSIQFYLVQNHFRYFDV